MVLGSVIVAEVFPVGWPGWRESSRKRGGGCPNEGNAGAKLVFWAAAKDRPPATESARSGLEGLAAGEGALQPAGQPATGTGMARRCSHKLNCWARRRANGQGLPSVVWLRAGTNSKRSLGSVCQ